MTPGAENLAARVPLRTLGYPTTHAFRQGTLDLRIPPLAFADVAVPNAFKRVLVADVMASLQ